MEEINENDELADISVNEYGEVLPEKNDKIALIDADTLVYTACLAAENKVELMPKNFYGDEEWLELLSNPTYDEGEHAIWESDIEDVRQFFLDKLKKILDLTGCQKYELHFTGGGKESFRYKLYPEYKANRKYIRRPMHLVAMKEWCCEHHNGTIHDLVEADDVVVYLKRNNPEKYILCCVDKDVYNAVEGQHFNYYESGKYNINMKWVNTTAHDAYLWPFKQAIVGDTSDNIIGIKGLGPARVEKLMETWDNIPIDFVKTFIDKGRTEEEAMLNLKLVTCGDEQIMKEYFDGKERRENPAKA